MRRNYMAFCKCGGLVAMATAHTIQELADHGKDAKKWEKQGFKVELREEPDDEPMPVWCKNARPGTCDDTATAQPEEKLQEGIVDCGCGIGEECTRATEK